MQRVDYQELMIQDLVNLEKGKELNLTPWYQRRSVWTQSMKAYLINTLFVHMPIPSIYTRYTLDIENEKVVKEVVDGQQRLRSIFEYVGDKFAARHPDHKAYKKFSELSNSEKKTFLLSKLSVGQLVDASDSDVIEMFGRLNSVSKTLNQQEKRNAKYGGACKHFCLSQASMRLPFWRDYAIFSSTDISRMGEVEFISDLSLNMLEGLQDFRPSALDVFYLDNEAQFIREEELSSRMDNVFDFLLTLDKSILKDTIFSRAPVFFSLFLVLDARLQLGAINAHQLISSMYDVDARFNLSREHPLAGTAEDSEFVTSCTQTVQRIKARQIRHKYLTNHLI